MSTRAFQPPLRGDLEQPGTDAYVRATTPWAAAARQRPAAVVRPADADDVAATVRAAADHGLRVLPQATGHGARDLGADHVLLDTSALADVEVDAGARRAVVGAGATWGRVQAVAAEHGLLGAAGTAPSVGAVGYTLLGGVGWFTRPHGLASAGVHAARWVDGTGTVRRASADADDALDREAWWACRGGGGVGVVTSLEIALVPAEDVWAGTLVWPLDAVAEVAAAWASALRDLGPDLTSSAGIAMVPPHPAVPEALHGRAIVRVLGVSTSGEEPWRALREGLGAVGDPLVEDAGPCGHERLGALHLDPPGPVASTGEGRWLDDRGFELVPDALTAVDADPVLPLVGVEVRHVGTDVAADGALAAVPGPLLLHTVGRAGEPDAWRGSRDAIDVVHGAVASASVARTAAFCDGPVDDALPSEVLARLRTVHEAADPDGVVLRPHVLG